MPQTADSLRRRIFAASNSDPKLRAVTKRIERCRTGRCDGCGDLCPVKAQFWKRTSVPLITSVLENAAASIYRVRFTRAQWIRCRGELALDILSPSEKAQRHWAGQSNFAGQAAIEKTLRRALDKLNSPSVVAVGMIDAWYGNKQWEIGASLLITGSDRSKLFEAFPQGEMAIKTIDNARKATISMLDSSRTAKRTPPTDDVRTMPTLRQREYYQWLAGLKSNDRLFRYGCDRYFNALVKTARPIRPKMPKRRKYPIHLVPHMFGNHPSDCPCRACGGVEKHRRYEVSK